MGGRVKNYFIKKFNFSMFFHFVTIFFLCLFVFTVSSCNMNEPVRDWFDYYTDTAAVDSDEIINDYYRNPSGVICFESNTDRSLTLYLRNPQRYVIEFNYEFSNPAMKAFASNYSPVTFVQSSDGNTARMLFTEEFLHAVDMGLCTDADGNIVKDISGDITMM